MKTLKSILIFTFIALLTNGAWSQNSGVTLSVNPPEVAPATTPAPVTAPAMANPVTVAPAAPVVTPAAPNTPSSAGSVPSPAPTAPATTTQKVSETVSKSASKTIKTGEGKFTAMRGAKGVYWNYTPDDSGYGIILKETENNEKSIVLEGYGLKFNLDLVNLRLIFTDGTSRKAANIDEVSSEINPDNVIEITYGAGKFNFIEDVDGQQDIWVQTLSDGKKYQLMDQGGLILYDPIRKILIGLDIEKKLITFDVEAKKPFKQKMIDLRAAP